MVAHLCPVCVEDYDPGFHAPLCAPCGHSICRGCAVKLEGGRCPQCRTDLPAASDMPVVRSLIPGLTESTAGQVGCDATEMQVFVRTMDGRTHNVCVPPSNTVDELKAKVAKLTGVKASEQRLIHWGQMLGTGTLESNNVKTCHTIDLCLRMRGG